MPSDLSIPPRPSSFLQPTRASSELVDGYTTCRANITCSPRRASQAHLPSVVLSLVDIVTACRLYDQQLNSKPCSTRYNRPNNPATSVLRRRNASRNRLQKRASKRSSKYVFICPSPLTFTPRSPVILFDRPRVRTVVVNRAPNWRSNRCCERLATGC